MPKSRKDILNKKDSILKWIEQKKSKKFISEQLDCSQFTLNVWLKKMNIDYAGMQDWSFGLTFSTKWKPVHEYLKKGTNLGSDYLKKLLFKHGIKEKKCENKVCQRTEWNGKEIPLQLHHKDGDKFNNELSNLEILCANCHGQTDNFSGKSLKGKGKQRKNYCLCGKKISLNAKKCKSCSKKEQNRKITERPNLQILLDDINNMSYLKVGRKYGVSDNSIRKWIKSYGVIPPKKRFTNENRR